MRFCFRVAGRTAVRAGLKALRRPEACPSVPDMGRISLDKRSQPEPMTVTVANRKA